MMASRGDATRAGMKLLDASGRWYPQALGILLFINEAVDKHSDQLSYLSSPSNSPSECSIFRKRISGCDGPLRGQWSSVVLGALSLLVVR